MGLWWESVDVQVPDQEFCLEFPGHLGSISKRWPVLWRFGQVWHLLDIHQNADRSIVDLFFHSQEQGTMRYKFLLTTPYVAVRVGPDPIKFWLYSYNEGKHVKPKDTGYQSPGFLCSADKIMTSKDFYAVVGKRNYIRV